MMLTVNVTIFQWQSKCLVFIKSMKFVNQKDFPDILANIYWKSFVVFCFCLCKYARFDSSIISSLSRSRSRHSLTLSLCVCVLILLVISSLQWTQEQTTQEQRSSPQRLLWWIRWRSCACHAYLFFDGSWYPLQWYGA